jgi:hypothetical protein
MQSLTLALAITAVFLSLLSLSASGAVLVLTLAKRLQQKPAQLPETTIEMDIPQVILDQMPSPKNPPQTVEQYTRMLRESQPEYLFDSED